MQEIAHNEVVTHLFRHEYGKIIAILTHKFGTAHIENIEDAVQESLLKAMQVWGFKNIPNNPSAWILRVASNTLIDSLRRNTKTTLSETVSDYQKTETTNPQELNLENTLSDNQLNMIFACCHPSLSKESQIILTLKLIGGFNNKEIAHALLKKEDAVAKAFTRAKKRLQEQVTNINIPVEIGLKSRLQIVLKIIYLLFSEGYAPRSGAFIIKKDLCFEAIRLALLLVENKFCNHPEVHALLALMCFHTSRFEARVDENMELVDLEHQDRSKYDRELMKIGTYHFEHATKTDEFPSDYHLQAALSYYHCMAPTYEATQWNQILNLYDLQLKRMYSPIIDLNRIIAFSYVFDAKKAFQELQTFEKKEHFTANTLFYATKAMLLEKLHQKPEALKAIKKAITLCENDMEKTHLIKKETRLKSILKI